MMFDIDDWFWAIGGDTTRFWSSKAGKYVDRLPKGAGLSRIANEYELIDVLVRAGMPEKAPPMPSAADRLAALVGIDRAKAEAAGFTDDEIKGRTAVVEGDARLDAAADAMGMKTETETESAQIKRRLKALEGRKIEAKR